MIAALEKYTGNYLIAGKFQATGCFNLGNQTIAGGFGVTISQSGSTMSMIWHFPAAGTRTYSDGYTQSGHMGMLGGNYICSSGEVGEMVFVELTNHPGVMTGRLVGQSSNLGCNYTGYFAGIDPNKSPQ